MTTTNTTLDERERELAQAQHDHAAALEGVKAAETRFDDDPATEPELRAAREAEATARTFLERAQRRREQATTALEAAEKSAAFEEFDAQRFEARQQYELRVSALAERVGHVVDDLITLHRDLEQIESEQQGAAREAEVLTTRYGFGQAPSPVKPGDTSRFVRTLLGEHLFKQGRPIDVPKSLLDAFQHRPR